jgi:hypothetical protein
MSRLGEEDSMTKKDVSELIARAQAKGWEYLGRSKSNHHRIRWPQTGQVLTLPSTPGRSSVANAESDIARISGPLRDKPGPGRTKAARAADRRRPTPVALNQARPQPGTNVLTEQKLPEWKQKLLDRFPAPQAGYGDAVVPATDPTPAETWDAETWGNAQPAGISTIELFIMHRLDEIDAMVASASCAAAGPARLESATQLPDTRYIIVDHTGEYVATIAHRYLGFVLTNDPARSRRETAIKRAILALHERIPAADHTRGDRCRTCHSEVPESGVWPCPTLRLLASVYADHPDYQPDWGPEAMSGTFADTSGPVAEPGATGALSSACGAARTPGSAAPAR